MTGLRDARVRGGPVATPTSAEPGGDRTRPSAQLPTQIRCRNPVSFSRALAQRHRLSRLQYLHLDAIGASRDSFAEGVARLLESASRQAPQTQRVKRAPVD